LEEGSGVRIAVIGGGIGGLSAVLHLLQAGFDVHVYEQAPRIGEIGAGIQISPNAWRLVIRLGLKPAMDRVGVRPAAFHRRRWDDGLSFAENPFGGPEIDLPRGDEVGRTTSRQLSVSCP
jgi:salicylate hydroxylase